MKVVIGYPPNIDEIRKHFKINDLTVFTWGDIIYAQTNHVADHVMIHEGVHEKQQSWEPQEWWEKYIADPGFRFQQELAAYRAQYKYFVPKKDRNTIFRFLHKIATDLSSGLYGNIVSYEEAKRLIKEFTIK